MDRLNAVATLRTAMFNSQKFCIPSEDGTSEFCVVLRTNSNYLPAQHLLISRYVLLELKKIP
jgi:hypothetical protein